MTQDRLKAWLAILATCYATDRAEAAAAFRDMAPLLRGAVRDTDMTPDCASHVATRCRRVPSYGQLMDAVREWRTLYGPREEPRALPAPQRKDPAPMTDEQRAAWQAHWAPKLAARKASARVAEEKFMPPRGNPRCGHLSGETLRRAREASGLYRLPPETEHPDAALALAVAPSMRGGK